MFRKISFTLAALVCLGLPQRHAAANADMQLDAAQRMEVIERLVAEVAGRYVFPDKAQQMVQAIRERNGRGEYDAVHSAAKFADLLTAHLQAAVPDLHMVLFYEPDAIPETPADALPREVQAINNASQKFTRPRSANVRCVAGRPQVYEIGKVDCLSGNVGYLELDGFNRISQKTVDEFAAAMNRLARTRALIIDLRNNAGGDPSTVATLAAYLFDRPRHLQTLHWRAGNRSDQFWTNDAAVAQRYGASKKVYVLTGPGTYSSGELLAYALQTLGRAVVVGQKTGGAAHAAFDYRLTAHFKALIPVGYSVNAMTGTDWERVGVIPDVPAPAADALAVALALAKKEGI